MKVTVRQTPVKMAVIATKRILVLSAPVHTNIMV